MATMNCTSVCIAFDDERAVPGNECANSMQVGGFVASAVDVPLGKGSWFHVEPGGSQGGEGAVAVVKVARKAPTVT